MTKSEYWSAVVLCMVIGTIFPLWTGWFCFAFVILLDAYLRI